MSDQSELAVVRQEAQEFAIRPAERGAVAPLVAFYGKSGGGKTLSALLTMRGLVGAKGRIIGIDSENKRMSIFADLVPGGFSVVNLAPPFSPDRYWDAIQAIGDKADGIVIDSFSHEWAGEGGVLDMQEKELDRMAGDNYGKREACKMAAWIKPKMVHKRLVERVLRLKQPLIVCLRGEEKTHIEKKDGKTVAYTDKFSTPISDPRFIFEMLVHAEAYAKPNAGGHMVGGYLRITKITHHDIIGILPKEGEQIGIAHGEALAKWCAGGKAEKPRVRLDFPTEATRRWMIGELKDMPDLALEYFQKAGQLSAKQVLADLELRFVPNSKPQLTLLKNAITNFGNGEEAKQAFDPHPLAL